MSKYLKRISYTSVLVAIFIALFIWGRAAEAGEARIGLGVGTFNVQGAIYQDLLVTTDEQTWYAQVTRIGNDEHFDVLTRYSAGYRVNWRDDKFAEPYLRLGMAHFDKEPTYRISDKWSFDMAVGIRFKDVVELEAQHNSTAGRTNYNYGLDSIVLGVVLPFGD